MKEYGSLAEAIRSIFGEAISVDRTVPVSGGDINDARAVCLSDGSKVFMKSNRRENIDFFRKEAEGLYAIKKTGTLKTPEVLALGYDGSSSFLLLSYIGSAGRVPDFNKHFGRNLALMHSAPCEDFLSNGRYGFAHDNYIGAGYQLNEPRESWTVFFRDCRLKPQFERAERYFDRGMRKRIDILLDRIDRYLTEPEKPSLLHGDLWSGNYMTGSDGEAWLIDPAAYVGHHEADLAMTELFGGFGGDFYSAYRDTKAVGPGYDDRKDLYNLYHLLNHLNLFGGSYFYSVQRILDRYC